MAEYEPPKRRGLGGEFQRTSQDWVLTLQSSNSLLSAKKREEEMQKYQKALDKMEPNKR